MTLCDPDFNLPWPVYPEAGKHQISIANLGMGMNLDSIAIHDYTLLGTQPSFESGVREASPPPSFEALESMLAK